MGKIYILNKFYKMIKYILWTNLSKHKGSIIWVTNLSMFDSLDWCRSTSVHALKSKATRKVTIIYFCINFLYTSLQRGWSNIISYHHWSPVVLHLQPAILQNLEGGLVWTYSTRSSSDSSWQQQMFNLIKNSQNMSSLLKGFHLVVFS